MRAFGFLLILSFAPLVWAEEPVSCTVTTGAWDRQGEVLTTKIHIRIGPETYDGRMLQAKDSPSAAVLFGHSSIKSLGWTTDLMPMAEQLALSGALVLVADAVLAWPPPYLDERPFDDPPHDPQKDVFRCLLGWLHEIQDRGLIDLDTFASIDPGYHPRRGRRLINKPSRPGPRPGLGTPREAWAPMGAVRNPRNTDLMSTPSEYLRTTQWLQRHLDLPLRPAPDFHQKVKAGMRTGVAD